LNVRVKLFGDVATVAGAASLEASVRDPAVLSDLLVALDVAAGRKVSESITDSDGRLLPSIAVLVNGSNAYLKQGLETPLADGDTVSVMPLLGGGGAL
jgi:molybdopterin synthase sulfur carrier subunit